MLDIDASTKLFGRGEKPGVQKSFSKKLPT